MRLLNNPATGIPPRWADILAVVQQAAPEAILAGGSLRDLENGAPVKDLDIFVRHRDGEYASPYLHKLQQLDTFTYRRIVTSFESCLEDSDCVLSETFPVGGLDVNIVHLDGSVDMERVLTRIDFGICQIGYDGKSITTTEAYRQDRAKRTFTVTRFDSTDDNARTLRRWERISQKYPGWTLVNPWVAA